MIAFHSSPSIAGAIVLAGFFTLLYFLYKKFTREEKPYIQPETLGYSLDGDESLLFPTLESAEKVKTIEKVYRHFTDGSKYPIHPEGPQCSGFLGSPVTGQYFPMAISGVCIPRKEDSYPYRILDVGNSSLAISSKSTLETVRQEISKTQEQIKEERMIEEIKRLAPLYI